MKRIFSFSNLIIVTLALVGQSFAAGPAKNLVAGVGPVKASVNWGGFSSVSIIAGSTLTPAFSTTTVLYIAFTAGTEADISNMVLYKTLTRNTHISSVVPVTLNGIVNPSINLTDISVCPVQPVSAANPCIIRLDPITLTLSTGSDYYFATFFAANDNNRALGLSQPVFNTSDLTGLFVSGDLTTLTPGQVIPVTDSGVSYGLIAVMTN